MDATCTPPLLSHFAAAVGFRARSSSSKISFCAQPGSLSRRRRPDRQTPCIGDQMAELRPPDEARRPRIPQSHRYPRSPDVNRRGRQCNLGAHSLERPLGFMGVHGCPGCRDQCHGTPAPVNVAPRYCTLSTFGACQVPLSASSFGQYSRIAIMNGPSGAGSQFDSLALPGDSCWI